ncbi:MAG: NAD(P)/FAD-dependent oxidoreductase [Bacillota bacterium]
MIRVNNIKVDLDHRGSVEKVLLRKLGIAAADLVGYRIVKESIDARKDDMIYFVYTIDADVKNEDRLLAKRGDNDLSASPQAYYEPPLVGNSDLCDRPVVVGCGPAGLFAGLLLAEMGYRPLIMERGADVETRSQAVERFWQGGPLDPESNVQFGEGGAGTFSDGKLTTLIRDLRIRKVLQELVLAGAPDDILYTAKPHVGTDILKRVVKSLRQRIIALGGEVRFHSKLTDLALRDGGLIAVEINGKERVPAEIAILALGHSARDTFAMLHQRGLSMTAKPFSIGVRVEHRQEWINQSQFKRFAEHPNLGAADYKLSYHSPHGRSAYTFCMCPGGLVVAAASEPGCVVTNGMSEHARNAANANSAILVGVDPGDFGSEHPLAGVEFQRRWERAAFDLAGRDYRAPAQRVGDFLADQESRDWGVVEPSYRPGVVLSQIKHCLPDYVIGTLQEAIQEFDRRLKGFAHPEAVLTGVETRSSSPVRIERGDSYEASIRGVYPAGEGAGYAGGIISAAVDGIRVAEAVISRYKPLH